MRRTAAVPAVCTTRVLGFFNTRGGDVRGEDGGGVESLACEFCEICDGVCVSLVAFTVSPVCFGTGFVSGPTSGPGGGSVGSTGMYRAFIVTASIWRAGEHCQSRFCKPEQTQSLLQIAFANRSKLNRFCKPEQTQSLLQIAFADISIDVAQTGANIITQLF